MGHNKHTKIILELLEGFSGDFKWRQDNAIYALPVFELNCTNLCMQSQNKGTYHPVWSKGRSWCVPFKYRQMEGEGTPQ